MVTSSRRVESRRARRRPARPHPLNESLTWRPERSQISVLRRSSALVTSDPSTSTFTFAPARSRVASASRRAASRATSTRSCPRRARRSAKVAPMPDDAPVTSGLLRDRRRHSGQRLRRGSRGDVVHAARSRQQRESVRFHSPEGSARTQGGNGSRRAFHHLGRAALRDPQTEEEVETVGFPTTEALAKMGCPQTALALALNAPKRHARPSRSSSGCDGFAAPSRRTDRAALAKPSRNRSARGLQCGELPSPCPFASSFLAVAATASLGADRRRHGLRGARLASRRPVVGSTHTYQVIETLDAQEASLLEAESARRAECCWRRRRRSKSATSGRGPVLSAGSRTCNLSRGTTVASRSASTAFARRPRLASSFSTAP